MSTVWETLVLVLHAVGTGDKGPPAMSEILLRKVDRNRLKLSLELVVAMNTKELG
jgi:hypothetical protein